VPRVRARDTTLGTRIAASRFQMTPVAGLMISRRIWPPAPPRSAWLRSLRDAIIFGRQVFADSQLAKTA